MTHHPQVYTLTGKRVWVAGHHGMVGQALLRRLEEENCEAVTATRNELDLTRQADVERWVEDRKPQAIFVAAAKVGGILANDSYPASFLYDNLAIETNILHSAYKSGVERLLLLGSSCIYPKFAPQPIPEDALLSGKLEPTNEWYAIAKIAGVKMCAAYHKQYGCDFISALPTNLYGPGDNFDLASSHVLPALIRKAHDAKMSGQATIEIWGSGTPLREFLHVDDCADACVHLMKLYSSAEHVNVGFGTEISILDLAQLVCEIVGFQGMVVRDTSRPDGTPRKLMSTDKLRALGWKPRINLKQGIASVYRDYLTSAR